LGLFPAKTFRGWITIRAIPSTPDTWSDTGYQSLSTSGTCYVEQMFYNSELAAFVCGQGIIDGEAKS